MSTKILSPALIIRRSCAILLNILCIPLLGNAQDTINLEKVVARVDNYYILKSEINDFRDSYGQQGQKAPEDCQLLESMIIRKMLLAKAEIDSVTVEEAEVENQLGGRMNMMIRTFGTEKNLVEHFGKSIEAWKSDLRKEVRNQLLEQTMQQKIAGDVKITPNDVRKFFSAIPKDSLPYIPAEAEIGEIVRLATVTSEQKQSLRNKLLDFKKRALAGEDFGTLAKVYSEDVESAKNGGDLGFSKRGDMVAPFEGAALALKPGDISDPVESNFGFHLIQLIEIRGAEYHARHILLRPDYNNGTDVTEATRYLDSLRHLIMIDSLSFPKAAKEYSQDEQTAPMGGMLQNPNNQTSYLPIDQSMDPALYFTLDTLKVDSISPPLRYRTAAGQTAMRILWYKSKTEPHLANLTEDYEKIADIVLANKRNNALEDWFTKAQGDVYISVDADFKGCKIFGLANMNETQ